MGLLDLAYFSDDPESASVLQGAMAMLHGADSIIIDLRRNMGGNPIMVDRLLTYFFNKQVQLTSIRWRNDGHEHTDEQWTLPFVPGERMPDVPLFVLTSVHTFSAAEQCAYDLQVLHRATLVGETTGGGANPAAATHALGGHFEAFIPNGEALNPITHTNWEGVGVRPDELVSAERSLLDAYTRALKAGIPKVSAPHLERARKKALADPASALRDAGFSSDLPGPSTTNPKN
ncbi:MAG: S41 family peptidase [Acidobacteriota bacterium]|nr:S41 family peptidase [Acidobacteriota bacterium]